MYSERCFSYLITAQHHTGKAGNAQQRSHRRRLWDYGHGDIAEGEVVIASVVHAEGDGVEAEVCGSRCGERTGGNGSPKVFLNIESCQGARK